MEQLAREMDTVFRENIVSHFEARMTKLVEARLAEKARVPNGWPRTPEFPVWLADHANAGDNQRLEDAAVQLRTWFSGLEDKVYDAICKFLKSAKLLRTTRWDSDTMVQSLVAKAEVPPNLPESASFTEVLAVKILKLPAHEHKLKEYNDALQKISSGRVKREIEKFITEERSQLERSLDGMPIIDSSDGERGVNFVQALEI